MLLYYTNLDGIILGGSSLEHIIANIDACKEGPLDESQSHDSHMTVTSLYCRSCACI